MRPICALLAGLLISSVAWAGDLLQKDDLLAICGDSITEQKQYSVMLEAYLTMCRSEPVRCVTLGWGGDSLSWLYARHGQEHILSLRPSVVLTCYGMNDGGYRPADQRIIARYHDGMANLIDDMQIGGARLVIAGSPGCVDLDTYRTRDEAIAYNQALGMLRDVGKALALESEMPFADLHQGMMDVMTKAKARYGSAYHVAGADGVHPAANGHLVMAYTFLRAMEMDGEIGTFQVNMADGSAQVSQGHKLLSARPGEITIESSRYPFCFYGHHSSPDATAGIIDFLPFNADLNRLILMVENAPKLTRVTWGDESREFTADKLAEGINLAKHFASDTPFDAAFAKVVTVIRKKQQYETSLYRGFLASYAEMQAALEQEDGDAAEALTRIRDAMMRRDDKLADEVRAAVVPIRHTIKIERVD